MPAPTNTERINKLEAVTNTLVTKLDSLDRDFARLRTDLDGSKIVMGGVRMDVALLGQLIGDIRSWKDQLEFAALETELAVQREQLRKLREEVDKSGGRFWSVFQLVLAAVVGGLISAAIAYYVPKK